jgi:hypothetical protein
LNPEKNDPVNVLRIYSVDTAYKLNVIHFHRIRILDLVKFLTFDEFYNVKLVFYSVELVSIALLLAVGFGHTHTFPPRIQTP